MRKSQWDIGKEQEEKEQLERENKRKEEARRERDAEIRKYKRTMEKRVEDWEEGMRKKILRDGSLDKYSREVQLEIYGLDQRSGWNSDQKITDRKVVIDDFLNSIGVLSPMNIVFGSLCLLSAVAIFFNSPFVEKVGPLEDSVLNTLLILVVSGVFVAARLILESWILHIKRNELERFAQRKYFSRFSDTDAYYEDRMALVRKNNIEKGNNSIFPFDPGSRGNWMYKVDAAKELEDVQSLDYVDSKRWEIINSRTMKSSERRLALDKLRSVLDDRRSPLFWEADRRSMYIDGEIIDREDICVQVVGAERAKALLPSAWRRALCRIVRLFVFLEMIFITLSFCYFVLFYLLDFDRKLILAKEMVDREVIIFSALAIGGVIGSLYLSYKLTWEIVPALSRRRSESLSQEELEAVKSYIQTHQDEIPIRQGQGCRRVAEYSEDDV